MYTHSTCHACLGSNTLYLQSRLDNPSSYTTTSCQLTSPTVTVSPPMLHPPRVPNTPIPPSYQLPFVPHLSPLRVRNHVLSASDPALPPSVLLVAAACLPQYRFSSFCGRAIRQEVAPFFSVSSRSHRSRHLYRRTCLLCFWRACFKKYFYLCRCF